MKTLSLPAYFAAYGTMLSTILALGWTIQLDPMTPQRWNHPSVAWTLLDTVALPVATVLTIREAKARRRPDAGQAWYREAVRIGQPIGDVSRWSEWIRRDRTQACALAITSVLGAGWWVVEAFLYGPWWAGAHMALLAACIGWLAWRVLRNLHTLSQYLSTPSE